MPADPSVIASLQQHSIAFEEMPCDPELADTADFCRAYDVPLEKSANTILVASRRPEGKMVACLVLATTRLDVNGVVRRRMEVKKASFANAEQTMETTGMAIGGVTVFGLPPTIPVWVDRRVLECDWIIVGAGSRTAKIRLDPAQLIDRAGFEVVDDLAQPVSS
ncbi:MAG TPA: YbaK/EbsC family protein [Acidimicrobiia bacterium]|jgi:prolyl-tRNA editing enzyme YbaK/EbsC (Cys-tRNA(Pro) deacylase)